MKLDFQSEGSNYRFSDKLMSPNVQKSGFDLTYLNSFTAKQGALYPVFFSYYYPSDSMSLQIENLIRLINPPVVPLLSRIRIFFHMFKVDYSQMWQYWYAFMSKGYSGKFETVLPTMKAKVLVDGKINPYLARGSLADFLGFNLYSYDPADYNDSTEIELPVLPFLAYQMIYRNYYVNFNVASAYATASDDPEWLAMFPDNEYDLMIKSSLPQNFTLDGSSQETDEPLNPIKLGELRYRDYAEDYFTSAMPWPMRGDVPVLELGSAPGTDSIFIASTPYGDVPITMKSSVSFKDDSGNFSLSSNWNTDAAGVYAANNDIIFSAPTLTGSYPEYSTDNLLRVNIAMTQPALKLLWTNTLITEKLARTDGTYGQFIQTFFNVRPTHYFSHKPTYLGGTFQPLSISQVLQTAPGETGTLGTQGATGISSASDFVGQFSADDFGVCMCLMSIMPDTYYSQGIMKEHLYRTQDDFPLPERALLGVQPVTRQEIYNNPADDESNLTLFGYQGRLDELRYRANEIHGEVANPENLSFFPFTQARVFDAPPELNPQFLTSKDNIRNDWLTAPNEYPFVCQIANRVNATRPIPYYAPPSAVMM